MFPLNEKTLQEGIDYELLSKAAEAKNLSPAQIETLCNVPEGTIKNILTGKTRNPGVVTLVPICNVLEVSVRKVLRQEVPNTTGNKVDDASILALKEMYQLQIKTIKETSEEHIKNIREHYERHIAELKQHNQDRLKDKEDHIKTIILDKKWFRLASVVGVMAIIGIFFFIEFMTPGHGWFNFDDKHNGALAIVGIFSFAELIAIIFMLFNKNKDKDKK